MLLQLPVTFWLITFIPLGKGELFLLRFLLALLEGTFSNAGDSGISIYHF